MLAVIRVLTTTDEELLSAHGRIISEKFKIPTRSYCIGGHPRGLYDDETERTAIPKIVELAVQVAPGAQAIFISCAADPGLREVRSRVKVPVIGAGSAAAAVGLALGGRIGVLNLTESTPPAVASVLGTRMVGEARPDGVVDTMDLMTPQGKAGAMAAARRLVQMGAEAIVLACTGYATIGLARELRAQMGISVVDAVEAGGLMASYALGAERLSGALA